MASVTLLSELHVREFVSRQKRLDELDARDRERRARTGPLGSNGPGDWRRSTIAAAGPLCLLDAVGQAEESWLELFEHAPRCDLPGPEETQAIPTAHLKPKPA